MSCAVPVRSTAPAHGALARPGFEEEALPCLDAVYHFALRLRRGDEDAAADLTQDTFLRAYRGWATFRPGTRILSWLFTICRNAAIREGEPRGRRCERTFTDIGVEGTEALGALAARAGTETDDPEADFFDALVDDEVLRAVDRLPTEFREAVVLSDIHDLSYAEISEILQLPSGTVKSRIHRGRRILRENLRSYATSLGFAR